MLILLHNFRRGESARKIIVRLRGGEGSTAGSNQVWEVTSAVYDPPNIDSVARFTRLIDDQPRPNGEGARVAVKLGTGATNPGPFREIGKRALYSSQNQFGTIVTTFASYVVEQLGKIALGSERFDDCRQRALLVFAPLPAFGDDVIHGL